MSVHVLHRSRGGFEGQYPCLFFQVNGQNINGDTTWYDLNDGQQYGGYSSGYYVFVFYGDTCYIV